MEKEVFKKRRGKKNEKQTKETDAVGTKWETHKEKPALGRKYSEWGYKQADNKEGLLMCRKKSWGGRTCVSACWLQSTRVREMGR